MKLPPIFAVAILALFGCNNDSTRISNLENTSKQLVSEFDLLKSELSKLRKSIAVEQSKSREISDARDQELRRMRTKADELENTLNEMKAATNREDTSSQKPKSLGEMSASEWPILSISKRMDAIYDHWKAIRNKKSDIDDGWDRVGLRYSYKGNALVEFVDRYLEKNSAIAAGWSISQLLTAAFPATDFVQSVLNARFQNGR